MTLSSDEFSWKILAVSLFWAVLLFPGVLIGPVRVFLGSVPVLIDPSYVLVILGGILFGIWGGVVSPFIAVTAAYLIRPGEHSAALYLASLAVHMINGTVVPIVRDRCFARMRRLEVRALLTYGAAGLVLVPLVNGLFYAVFRQVYFLQWVEAPGWELLLSTSLYFAVLLVFPGELIFQFIPPEARRMGVLIENRWGLWSRRTLVFQSNWLVVAALVLCLLPLPVHAVLAYQAWFQHREAARTQWIRNRTYWNKVHGMKIQAQLDELRQIQRLCAWRIRMIPENRDAIDELLLLVLKSHDGIRNLEFVSRDDADFRSRTAFYVGSEQGLDGWARDSFGVTRLFTDSAEPWFTMGERIFLADGREAGWLMLRCGARPIVEEFIRNQALLPERGRVLLADRTGRVIWGDTALSRLPLDAPDRFHQTHRGRGFFLDAYPVLGAHWNVVYLEEYDFLPGMREHLAEHAGWAICIHVSTFLFLLGITVLTRALGKGIENPTDLDDAAPGGTAGV